MRKNDTNGLSAFKFTITALGLALVSGCQAQKTDPSEAEWSVHAALTFFSSGAEEPYEIINGYEIWHDNDGRVGEGFHTFFDAEEACVRGGTQTIDWWYEDLSPDNSGTPDAEDFGGWWFEMDELETPYSTQDYHHGVYVTDHVIGGPFTPDSPWSWTDTESGDSVLMYDCDHEYER